MEPLVNIINSVKRVARPLALTGMIALQTGCGFFASARIDTPRQEPCTPGPMPTQVAAPPVQYPLTSPPPASQYTFSNSAADSMSPGGASTTVTTCYYPNGQPYTCGISEQPGLGPIPKSIQHASDEEKLEAVYDFLIHLQEHLENQSQE